MYKKKMKLSIFTLSEAHKGHHTRMKLILSTMVVTHRNYYQIFSVKEFEKVFIFRVKNTGKKQLL